MAPTVASLPNTAEGAGGRPQSAGSVRLEPVRRMSFTRGIAPPDDSAERILASAHIQSNTDLVAVGRSRRQQTADAVKARIAGAADSKETSNFENIGEYKIALRTALSFSIGEMNRWIASKCDTRKGSVLEWLVALPLVLRSNAACAESISMSDVDVEWLVRKAVMTLSVLLGSEDEQRAHAIRRGVTRHEMDGFVARAGVLRVDSGQTTLTVAGASTQPADVMSGTSQMRADNEWVHALATARVAPGDAAEYLLALFIYTANCKSRAVVDGWELSTEDEWVMISPPKRPEVHGYNSSPWAVMNWTLRVAYDASQDEHVRRLAADSLAPFAPLRDRIDEALSVLPKSRDIVFRGVNIPGLAHRYVLSHPVVFPPFTSTSTVGLEALAYMKGKAGTFFVIRSHSASRVDFVSVIPSEAEKLLPSFSRFVVLQKTSTTVLRMLECRYDIVTLAESGDEACTDADAVDAYVRSVRQMHFVYDGYLAGTYVEGRVGPLPPPCTLTSPFFPTLLKWLHGEGPSDRARGHLILMGSGGSGKTSATLAALCRLAGTEGVVPVFVPLATVKGLLTEVGALDRHIAQVLCLTSAQIELLMTTHTLVLLLESLDEVSIATAGVREGNARSAILGILDRNPRASRARVILSCRDEFLTRLGIRPHEMFGMSATYQYVQPFTMDDVSAFVRKQCVALTHDETTAKVRAVVAVARALGAMLNPCVLHMACRVDSVRLAQAVADAVGTLSPSSIYEAYLCQQMGDDPAGLRGMQRTALVMVSGDDWHMSLGDVAAAFEDVGVPVDEFWSRYLGRIPRRVENDADPSGAFAWWHRSIGEYLAARAFWTEPEAAIAAVQRPFSLDTPGVLSFFAGLARADLQNRSAICGGTLMPAVLKSRDTCDPAVLAHASNAIALVCASGHFMHAYDMSHIVVEDANLGGASFQYATLREAVFRRCDLACASFDFADVTGAQFPQSTCEIVLPVLSGHTYVVQDVCFSADGRYIASASMDNTVRVWDASNGKEVCVLAGHEYGVEAVSFAPDGSHVATGSNDGMIRLFEVRTGEEVKRLQGHERGVNSVAFSADGDLLASAAGDKTARVWRWATGDVVARLTHRYEVRDACFSRDGLSLLTGSDDGAVRVWSIASGVEDKTLAGHLDGVTGVRFSPDGTLIASCSRDGSVRVWNVSAGTAVRALVGHTQAVEGVCFSPDGSALVTCADDKTVRVWDVVTGMHVRTIEKEADSIRGVCWSPDGRLIASGCDSAVCVWDAHSRTSVSNSNGHDGIVTCVGMSPSANMVVSASTDKTVRVWERTTGRMVCAVQGHTGIVMSACFSPNAKMIASGAWDGKIGLWDSARPTEEPQFLVGHTSLVMCVAYSLDGRLIVSASADCTLRLWDAAKLKAVRILRGHTADVTCACFSHSGAVVASGSDDKAVALWETSTGRMIHTLTGHRGGVKCVAMATNDGLIASGADDASVIVWDAVSGALLRVLEGHGKTVNSVCFVADSTVLASGSSDASVRLWNVQTGEAGLVIWGHTAFVQSVAFSADGRFLCSGSGDQCIRVWDSAIASAAITKDAIGGDGGVVVTGAGTSWRDAWRGASCTLTDGASLNESDRIVHITRAYPLAMSVGNRNQFSCVGRIGAVVDGENTSPGLLACFGADGGAYPDVKGVDYCLALVRMFGLHEIQPSGGANDSDDARDYDDPPYDSESYNA